MQNRRGAARSALAQVRSRHVEIQKIEQTMVELAQLFEQMNQLVVEQGEIVQQIDDHGTRIHDDTKQANTQLAQAVSSAKGARKKKWWCLGICGMLKQLPSGRLNTNLLMSNSPHHHHCPHCCPRYCQTMGGQELGSQGPTGNSVAEQRPLITSLPLQHLNLVLLRRVSKSCLHLSI